MATELSAAVLSGLSHHWQGPLLLRRDPDWDWNTAMRHWKVQVDQRQTGSPAHLQEDAV